VLINIGEKLPKILQTTSLIKTVWSEFFTMDIESPLNSPERAAFKMNFLIDGCRRKLIYVIFVFVCRKLHILLQCWSYGLMKTLPSVVSLVLYTPCSKHSLLLWEPTCVAHSSPMLPTGVLACVQCTVCSPIKHYLRVCSMLAYLQPPLLL